MGVRILFSAVFICTFVFTPNSKSKISGGSPQNSIIVAVIDTGADLGHPLIRDNLWVNAGESGPDESGHDKAANGIDDDQNGFVDDVHGWNFIDDSNNINDEQGHGTHIAGIIAGQSLNFQSVSTVASPTKIMVLKYFDKDLDPFQSLRASTLAMNYAVQMGAHIINYSGGGENGSPKELKALIAAQQKGILVVAAAGNEKSNLDRGGFYPASYGLANIVSVAAMKDESSLLESSNYGANSVDIAAPGSQILSAAPGNMMAMMSGTSQATAYVSFVAAMYWNKHPHLTSAEVKVQLLERGQKLKVLSQKVRSEKMASRLE